MKEQISPIKRASELASRVIGQLASHEDVYELATLALEHDDVMALVIEDDPFIVQGQKPADWKDALVVIKQIYAPEDYSELHSVPSPSQ